MQFSDNHRQQIFQPLHHEEKPEPHSSTEFPSVQDAAHPAAKTKKTKTVKPNDQEILALADYISSNKKPNTDKKKRKAKGLNTEDEMDSCQAK